MQVSVFGDRITSHTFSQQQLGSFFAVKILRLQKVWPDYIDTEWALYNIVLLAIMIYISHAVSVAYRCSREHSRQLNRMYVEKKWLDSRINLISRKQAALSVITEQLKQEIFREISTLSIVERCERESLEKLEAKKKEDIDYIDARLSKLECSNASLRTRLLNMRASVSSSDVSSALSNGTSLCSPNTVYSHSSFLCKNIEDRELAITIIDSGMGSAPSASVNDMFTGDCNFFPYDAGGHTNNESSEYESDSDAQEKQLIEDFSSKSATMLSESFDTDITGSLCLHLAHLGQLTLPLNITKASLLILQLEDFAMKHGVCPKQCLTSVARALLCKSGLLDQDGLPSHSQSIIRLGAVIIVPVMCSLFT